MLTFDDPTHRYFWNGKPVPGVTGVLERQGLLSFGGASEDAMEAARALGTAVHVATQLHDQGTLVEESVHPLVAPYLAAYRRFLAEMRFYVTDIELRVYHEPVPMLPFEWAGTLDRLGEFPWTKRVGGPALIDIKTGTPQRATGPQTAAYLAALPKAERGRKRYGLYLRPDGTYSLTAYTAGSDLAAFLAALSLDNWKGNK